MKYFLENPNNPPVYVMQSLEYEPGNHKYKDLASEPLTQRAVLKTIREYSVGTFRYLRISRMMDIHGANSVDDRNLYQGDEGDRFRDWVNHLP